MEVDFDMTVDEVMRRWPATIRVFLGFGMHCVGCPIAGFHSIADACREHRAEPVLFLAALRAAADTTEASPASAVGRGALGDAEQPMGIA
jgi:hybrid cluster-associated redox disulfide protein